MYVKIEDSAQEEEEDILSDHELTRYVIRKLKKKLAKTAS